MKIKPKLLIPVAITLIAAIAFSYFLKREDFYYAGTIEATKVAISPRIASTIASLDVKEGQKITQSQTLCRLSGEDIKLAHDIAEADFKRAQKLYKNGSISQEAFDHLRFKHEDTKMRLDWTQIKSPLKGTVLNTYREAGEWIAPGNKLLTLANLQEVWAIFYVEQPMLSRLALGQKVTGILPEGGDRRFAGTISVIADEAEFTPKNVQTRAERTRLVFGVKVTFENSDEFLKPGMSIEAKLNPGT